MEKQKTEKTKNGEFIELEFTGKANGETFDTNIKEEAKKINLKIEVKPLIICIGQEMLVKGFDKALEDKEIGKQYKIKLSQEESFGRRNPSLIKTIPMRIFKEQNINPLPGIMLNLDGMVAKVLSVSGGRVMTDFNNPLAGKEIDYEFTIKKRITDDNEKINSLQDFFFRKRFEFKIEEKKIIFNKEMGELDTRLKEKFKEILGKDIEVEKEETEAKGKLEEKKEKEEKKEQTKEKVEAEKEKMEKTEKKEKKEEETKEIKKGR